MLSISALGLLFTRYPSPEADSAGAIGAAPMPITHLYLRVSPSGRVELAPQPPLGVPSSDVLNRILPEGAEDAVKHRCVFLDREGCRCPLHILAPFLSLQSSSVAQKQMCCRTSLCSCFHPSASVLLQRHRGAMVIPNSTAHRNS